LKDAEELGLGVWDRQLSDFVEEERAAFRELELPFF